MALEEEVVSEWDNCEKSAHSIQRKIKKEKKGKKRSRKGKKMVKRVVYDFVSCSSSSVQDQSDISDSGY
jgi:hypothetical protein